MADRREETRQLQQRVRLLEGSLQVRMNQLETLVEELRNTPGLTDGTVAGNRRLLELLDRIVQEARRTQVVLHVHADNGARLEAKDRLLEQAQQDLLKQDRLEEKLADSRLESRRLAAKVSEQSSLRQRFEQVRRSARKQDELLAEYECSHRDLNFRVQHLMMELDQERESRREQERTVQRLSAMLTESIPGRRPSPLSADAPAAPVTGPCEEAEISSPASVSRTLALRLEHERLCDEERAQRRQRRRMQVRQQPATYRQASGEAQRERSAEPPPTATVNANSGDNGQPDSDAGASHAAAAARALGSALARAEDAHCAETAAERAAAEARAETAALRVESAALRDELQEARAEAVRAATSVVELEDAREQWTAQIERELREHAATAERRSWALAEVANEVVLQADLRQLRTLQDEVHMQKAMGAAELRCAMLTDIVNQAAASTSCSVTSVPIAIR